MASFLAHITVMPHDALLDPQNKAVEKGLHHLGLDSLDQVRVGKHIRLQVQADSEEEANALVTKACQELLHNKVMEHFHFHLEALK